MKKLTRIVKEISSTLLSVLRLSVSLWLLWASLWLLWALVTGTPVLGLSTQDQLEKALVLLLVLWMMR